MNIKPMILPAGKFAPVPQVKRFFVKFVAALFFFGFIIQYSAKAQGSPPSCTLSGALETSGSGGVTVYIEVGKSGPNPNLVYSFDNSSGGAYIETYGPVIYDALANKATQTLTVVPGAATRGYNLKLTVTNASGNCECSKSVTITQ